MDPKAFELSMEQQFEFQRLQYEFQDLDHNQVLNQLMEAAQQLMIKDNLIRDLLKKANL
ncbi:NblA/ycf18 family protein [Oscillatoria sp. FACHB-1407]|uniref:NblA/ycf18 family protein n=1 Tax=Oscillatoria sp. FACHB-1407 TaxID=2692847 RepID=UPI001685AAC4|nr:NblA/ycf18 family protein [Oscillatoria sp. FACHB-1407]MBD2460715.1 NblA/ycf18 family protein [Oscillatoria sp. FACHB-1407]